MSTSQISSSLIEKIKAAVEQWKEDNAGNPRSYHGGTLGFVVAETVKHEVRELRKAAYLLGGSKALEISNFVENMEDFEQQMKAAADKI